jgi:hypothetical protein
MKRILLGTTALVAAGALGTGAAEAKFDVTVNGELYAAYGFVNQDDNQIGTITDPDTGITVPFGRRASDAKTRR